MKLKEQIKQAALKYVPRIKMISKLITDDNLIVIGYHNNRIDSLFSVKDEASAIVPMATAYEEFANAASKHSQLAHEDYAREFNKCFNSRLDKRIQRVQTKELMQ